MKKTKQIMLIVLASGSMVVALSAQKRVRIDKKEMKAMSGKKMSKIKLKALNLKALKAGDISSLADKPVCDVGDKAITAPERWRVNIKGPPPQVCEQFSIFCKKGDGTGNYEKRGPYLRCAERSVDKVGFKNPLEKMPSP